MTTEEFVGRYKIGKRLGKGTFSSVRCCTDVNTGKNYALKILDKQILFERDLEVQVNREICVMLKFSHRNVCTMRECFQTSEKVYLVLELICGGELFEKIKETKGLSEHHSRRYFQQLILGLNYCHKNGVAHRDLKPENLLLDESDTLKLSDFGLANTQRTSESGKVGNSMMLHTLCGTPNYVAPEVLLDYGYNGFKADIWSCGVILYVMLSGCLPFHDQHTHSLFEKIQEGSYVVPEYFSEGAKDLLSILLRVDPSTRGSIQDIIQHPWFRIGWSDDWLLEGELERTPSQNEIAEKVAQLKEQRKVKEMTATRPKKESRKKHSDSANSSAATPTTPQALPVDNSQFSFEEINGSELYLQNKELEDLEMQKAALENAMEEQRKQLENLNLQMDEIHRTKKLAKKEVKSCRVVT